jgi:hypothetical protein
MPATSIAGATFTVSVGRPERERPDHFGHCHVDVDHHQDEDARRERIQPDRPHQQRVPVVPVRRELGSVRRTAGSRRLRRQHHLQHQLRSGEWAGAALYCESAETTFDATGVAMCSATLTGELVFT